MILAWKHSVGQELSFELWITQISWVDKSYELTINLIFKIFLQSRIDISGSNWGRDLFWRKNTQRVKTFHLSFESLKSVESEKSYVGTFNFTFDIFKIFLHLNIHISGSNWGEKLILISNYSVDQKFSFELLTFQINWVWGNLRVSINYTCCNFTQEKW